jgi:hypothetical protein
MDRAANASVDTAVPAIATIELPLARRGRTVGAVVGFAGATANKDQGTAPPTLAAHSALEPRTAALDKCVTRAEALPGTGGVSGGDEFAIVLPDTTRGGDGGRRSVPDCADRVGRRRAAAGRVDLGRRPIHGADSAMYYVKDRGKNGIHVAG